LGSPAVFSATLEGMGMVQAKHITAVAVGLMAACLSGCGYATLDSNTTASLNSPASSPIRRATPSASTDSPSTTSDKTSATVLNSTTESGVTSIASPPIVSENVIKPHGRAYLFRGVAGLIYSRGMDWLAYRINRTGVTASVDTYLLWQLVANQAISDYRRDPQPITLIGHSAGGDSAVVFAEYLNVADIPVSLLVTYDPTRTAHDVPPNVQRYINVYQSLNVMGGGDVVQGRRFHGHYASFNLRDHREIVHINIEKAADIQEQLVTKISELAATPANVAEAVPLRLEVPATAAAELWDSGLAVAAHERDTLETLAASYHVPLWAMAQVNPVPKNALLTEGQRIIVPRHLIPMTQPSPVSSYAPSEH
jgi:LysM domain-containing protein